MPAEVASMLSVREVPWHRLSTIVQDAPTSADALKLAGLDWQVEMRPIFQEVDTTGGACDPYYCIIDGRMACVRKTDNRVYGIFTDEYRPCQNVQAFEIADALLGKGVTFETAGSLRDGARVWLLARLPQTLEIAGRASETVLPYLLISNSHDGSLAITIKPTPVRVVCANTLAMALQDRDPVFRVKHTGDPMKRVGVAARILGLTETYYAGLKAQAESMLAESFGAHDWQRLCAQLLPQPLDGATARSKEAWEREFHKLRVRLMDDDVAGIAGTKYGAFNAVAAYVDHYAGQRQAKDLTKRAEQATMRAWDDTTGLKAQAYRLLTV